MIIEEGIYTLLLLGGGMVDKEVEETMNDEWTHDNINKTNEIGFCPLFVG